MKYTDQHTSQDFARWADRNGITITGGTGQTLREWIDATKSKPQVVKYTPWWYWALLLATTMVAIVGLLT